MPERENLQVLLVDPSPALGFIAKRVKGDRRARMKAKAVEGTKRGFDVPLIHPEHKIEIGRRTKVAMKHDGNAADHNVANSRVRQRHQEKLDVGEHRLSVQRSVWCAAALEMLATDEPWCAQ